MSRFASCLMLFAIASIGDAADPIASTNGFSIVFTPLAERLVVGDPFFVEVSVTNLSRAEIVIPPPNFGENVRAFLSAMCNDNGRGNDGNAVMFFGDPFPTSRKTQAAKLQQAEPEKWGLAAGQTKRRVQLVNIWTARNLGAFSTWNSDNVTVAVHFEPIGDYRKSVNEFHPFQRRFQTSEAILEFGFLSTLANRTFSTPDFWFGEQMNDRLFPFSEKMKHEKELLLNANDSILKTHLLYRKTLKEMIAKNATEGELRAKSHEWTMAQAPRLRDWYSRCIKNEITELRHNSND